MFMSHPKAREKAETTSWRDPEQAAGSTRQSVVGMQAAMTRYLPEAASEPVPIGSWFTSLA